MGLGNATFADATRSIRNIFAMATMQCPPGILRELHEDTLHNEPIIVAQAPLATSRKRLPKTKDNSHKMVPYTRQEDPCQFVNKWVQKRNMIVTDENRVSVTRALRSGDK